MVSLFARFQFTQPTIVLVTIEIEYGILEADDGELFVMRVDDAPGSSIASQCQKLIMQLRVEHYRNAGNVPVGSRNDRGLGREQHPEMRRRDERLIDRGEEQTLARRGSHRGTDGAGDPLLPFRIKDDLDAQVFEQKAQVHGSLDDDCSVTPGRDCDLYRVAHERFSSIFEQLLGSSQASRRASGQDYRDCDAHRPAGAAAGS
jgi:hypothetical protein